MGLWLQTFLLRFFLFSRTQTSLLSQMEQLFYGDPHPPSASCRNSRLELFIWRVPAQHLQLSASGLRSQPARGAVGGRGAFTDRLCSSGQKTQRQASDSLWDAFIVRLGIQWHRHEKMVPSLPPPVHTQPEREGPQGGTYRDPACSLKLNTEQWRHIQVHFHRHARHAFKEVTPDSHVCLKVGRQN